MTRKTLTTVATAVTSAALTAAIMWGTQPATATPVPPPPADPFSQEAFPCQEDEVLTFHPSFGPDRVGCLHWDEITE